MSLRCVCQSVDGIRYLTETVVHTCVRPTSVPGRRDRVPQYETTLANGEDIGAPVGERLVRPDEGDTADVARIRYGIGVRRGVGRHVGDPEPPVTGETVLQQLAVARLEDVQRLGGPGEQDDRQRGKRELAGHR